jgi:thiol:disulfide interchange protein DsbA
MLYKIVFFLFVSFATLSQAESLGYEILTPAQPVQNEDKIEIIEFFSYGCPHCYTLDPVLEKWLKTKPDNVEFIRQPVIFSPIYGKYAKAYFVAEALGILDKVHADFFDAIHNKKQKLSSEEQLAKFFAAHGVDETEFRNTFNSFLIDTKMRQAKAMAPRYRISGVPAVIINGKYKTSGPLAKSNENIIKVMEQLIQQESLAK